MRENVNTVLNSKVRSIPFPQPFYVRFVFHNFATTLVKQIRHSLCQMSKKKMSTSTSLFFVYVWLGSILWGAYVQQALLVIYNKPSCSTPKSEPNSEDNQPYRHIRYCLFISRPFLGRLINLHIRENLLVFLRSVEFIISLFANCFWRSHDGSLFSLH